MADDTPEVPQEPPANPPPLPKSKSPIWDVFNKRQIHEPRSIPEEVRVEMGGGPQEELEETEIPNLAEIDRKLGNAFLRFHNELKSKAGGVTGVHLKNENRCLSIDVADGGFYFSKPEDPPIDRHPNLIWVENSSPFGSGNKNKYMHSKFYRGVEFPEYFRDEGGVLNRVESTYLYNFLSGIWHKQERLHNVSSIESYLAKAGVIDPEALPVVKPEQLEEAGKNGKHSVLDAPLTAEDYEQLQTILFEINSGGMEIDTTYYPEK